MPRRRGGLAGIWDRNKHIIKPLSTVAAGALTGGAAIPAMLGAGMAGFDRPGKGGIGFDFGAGLKGAAGGYLGGKAGQFLGSKMGFDGIGTLGRADDAISSAGSSLKNAVTERLGIGGDAASATAPTTGAAGVPEAPAGAAKAPSMLSKAWKFSKDNPEVLGRGLSAGATILDGAANRGVENRRLEFDERRYANEREDMKRRSEIAQRLYDMMMGQMSWNRPPRAGA